MRTTTAFLSVWPQKVTRIWIMFPKPLVLQNRNLTNTVSIIYVIVILQQSVYTQSYIFD